MSKKDESIFDNEVWRTMLCHLPMVNWYIVKFLATTLTLINDITRLHLFLFLYPTLLKMLFFYCHME